MAGMKIVARPEVIEYVRARGGRAFVWTMTMQYGYGRDVFVLEASTESPGANHGFVRFEGDGVDVLYDPGERGTPDELHLAVVGRFRKRLRAYWNGHSFATGGA